MPKANIGKEQEQAILNARELVADIERRDANEAETRRRVERVFEGIMGYDALKHLSRERAVHGAGDTEHVDFAIQVEEGRDAPPMIMAEIKRVGLELAAKHLKQASRYAIDAGCEWVLLTNAREWRLYHVEFGQPPKTKLVERWDLLNDDPEVLGKKFGLIGYKSVKRGTLHTLWERTQALAPRSLLKAVLSADAMRALRRVLKRDSGVSVAADHVVGALRKMLNENAASILQDVQVSLPLEAAERTRKRTKRVGQRIKLRDLVDADLIPVGTVLFVDYKSVRYEASVEADGSILFEGLTYKTPSAAGGAVTGKYGVYAPNGWTFWKFRDKDGTIKPLEAARQEYISQHGSREPEAQPEGLKAEAPPDASDERVGRIE